MNIDNKGLYYFDEKSIGKEIVFSLGKLEIKSKFYEIIDNPFLIIKKSDNINEDELLSMLLRFKDLYEHIEKTDLPVNYYKEKGIIKGQVIPYYEDSINLYNISKTKELDNLMNVYKKDDDKVHNLFLLYNDIVDIMEELYENGIYYYDSNSTNFVFKDNKVHLIDFDPKYVFFNKSKRRLIQTLAGIDDLVDRMNGRFLSHDEFIYMPRSFNGLRKHLVKIENRVRKK